MAPMLLFLSMEAEKSRDVLVSAVMSQYIKF